MADIEAPTSEEGSTSDEALFIRKPPRLPERAKIISARTKKDVESPPLSESTQLESSLLSASSLQSELDTLSGNAKEAENFTIFRTPHSISQSKKNLFEPSVISIGPFHRGRKNLRALEEQKRRFLRDFLSRNYHLSLDDCISQMKLLEKRTRRCYSETFDDIDSHSFVEMMLLDGCFLLEFFLKLYERRNLDSIFEVGWNCKFIKRDLLLQENQIPFFIVDKLQELIGINQERRMFIVKYLALFLLPKDYILPAPPAETSDTIEYSIIADPPSEIPDPPPRVHPRSEIPNPPPRVHPQSEIPDPPPRVHPRSEIPDSPPRVHPRSEIPDSPPRVHPRSEIPDSPPRVHPRSELPDSPPRVHPRSEIPDPPPRLHPRSEISDLSFEFADRGVAAKPDPPPRLHPRSEISDLSFEFADRGVATKPDPPPRLHPRSEISDLSFEFADRGVAAKPDQPPRLHPRSEISDLPFESADRGVNAMPDQIPEIPDPPAEIRDSLAEIPDPPAKIHHLVHLYYHYLVPNPEKPVVLISKSFDLTRMFSANRITKGLLHRFRSRVPRGRPPHSTSGRSLLPLSDYTGNLSSMVIPSATELKEAGLKFTPKCNPKHMLDISFERDVLKIPRLKITDFTKPIFTNLLAFEQSKYGKKNLPFGRFLSFLDNLVNTPNDVTILQECGIIENWLGSEEELANFINQATEGNFLESNHYLAELYTEVNRYTKSRCNRNRAKLMRDYFSSPWATMSVIVAFILLVLTFIQSFFAVFAYFRPPPSP